MAWDYEARGAVYLQIRDKLREDVINGKYGPNERIPGVRDLALEAKVNPNTMQRALVELELEGMVITKGTSGRYVTDDVSVIENAKTKVVGDITNDYLGRLAKFNIGKEEAIGLIRNAPDGTGISEGGN